MQQTCLISFEILNIKDLAFHYNLFKVSGVDPSVESYNKSISALVKKVGSEIRNIVVPTKLEGVNHLALPASAEPPQDKHTVGVHIFELQKLDFSGVIRFTTIEPEALSLAQEFLRGAIKRFLMRNRTELWGDGSRSYFTKTPFFGNSRLQVYGGFSFDVIVMADKTFAVTIDVSSRYVSPFTLKELLQNGTALNVSPRKPLHCLYEMCQDWFSIEVTGILNTPVSEQHFSFNGEDRTVYDHTLKGAMSDVLEDYKRKMQPSDPTITFRYPNKRSQLILHAASSLARPKYNTEHEYVKQVHRNSILAPQKRASLASAYLRKYLFGVALDGKKMVFASEPLKVPSKIFAVPDILVGNHQVLHVKNGTTRGIQLEELGKERLRSFLNNGVLDKESPFRQTYFLVPDTMINRKGVVTDFQARIIELIRQVSDQQFPLRVIPYQVASSLTLREQFNAIKTAIGGIGIQTGCLIVLLPKHSRPGLHNQLKKEYYKNYWMQCAKEDRLLSFFEQRADQHGNTLFQVIPSDEKKYNSYVRYFVLGLLQVHRRWISCLKTPLHYDIHLGIDVLNDFWGFTFVYEGGKHCNFYPEQRPTSQRDYKEKIPKSKMYSVLYENLKDHITSLKLKPNSLLVHRDGRSFDSEIHGLEKAIQQLVAERVLPENFSFGIVEIHKSTGTKLRLVQKQDGSTQFENPVIGSYYLFGAFATEAAIATTGYPFSKSGNNPYGFDGTALPLLIKLAYGDLELEKVAEDVFNLACLAWSAPDKASRLHLPIKLGDDYLEPIASKVDEDDSEEETQEQTVEVNQSTEN
jgi:hypothetical protein